MKKLCGGYTTGACAAAGAKAALIFARDKQIPREVQIVALDGTPLLIPVQSVEQEGDRITAAVKKFSGDDPDITNGATVLTSIKKTSAADIIFRAGEGVGTVTKPGLSVPVGEPAINPGPRKLIARVIEETTGAKDGYEVTIAILGGKTLAKKTLNPILGIEGGLSVIGSTGVLRPMSEEAFKNSLAVQLDVVKAANFPFVVLVPGKIGADIAEQYNLPKEATAQTSNFIGFMLEEAVERGFSQILLWGHLGKLAKVAGGSFHTHNRVADGRMETVAAYAALNGANADTVRQILATNATEDALDVLRRHNLARTVCNTLAERASVRAERYIFGKAKIGVVIVSFKGEILGINDTARIIGEAAQWSVTSRAK